MTARVAVAVVGAGQAGLAAGYHLRQAGVPFTILEAAGQVGGSWQGRWDSLELFTPARYSGLPGRPFPGAPGRYPRRDEVAVYLRDYAAAFELPVRLGSEVTALTSGYELTLASGDPVHADAVIVATGAFQWPRIPGFAGELAPQVRQLHSSQYRNPGQLAPGLVLVVGAGNSGVQLAAELAAAGHPVHLAVGTKQMPVPRRILGADFFWWLDRTGFLRAPVRRMPKWLAGEGDVLVGTSLRRLARDSGVVLRARATGVLPGGRGVTFADGGELEVATVLWATGYRPDFSWVGLPVLDGDGRPVHTRGVTASPGLYFLGLERLHTAGSSLLGWVGHDAAFVVSHIARGSGVYRSS